MSRAPRSLQPQRTEKQSLNDDMRTRMHAGDVLSKLCNICSGFPHIILDGDLNRGAIDWRSGGLYREIHQRMLAITPCWRLPTSLALHST